jgi:hypothetical protein
LISLSFVIIFPCIFYCINNNKPDKNQKTGGKYMEKCGVCGGDVPKQPSIAKDGTCDACHKKLVPEEEKRSKSNK